MLVGGAAIDSVEGHIVPRPHPGHEFNAQEGRQAKDRLRLAVGIGMQGVGLERGRVSEQAIKNVDRFPHPAGNEVAEQGNIRIADMVVRDASKMAVTHMARPQQVVFNQFNMRTIGNRGSPLPHRTGVQTACRQSHRVEPLRAWPR